MICVSCLVSGFRLGILHVLGLFRSGQGRSNDVIFARLKDGPVMVVLTAGLEG